MKKITLIGSRIVATVIIAAVVTAFGVLCFFPERTVYINGGAAYGPIYSGNAEKAQVDMMVHTLLPAAGKMKPDAADAAAAAICHSFLRVTKERLKMLSELTKK